MDGPPSALQRTMAFMDSNQKDDLTWVAHTAMNLPPSRPSPQSSVSLHLAPKRAEIVQAAAQHLFT
jgi:hypothetical protein